MALDNIFLEYPKRAHGMDHDRYNWRNLFAEKHSFLKSNDQLCLMVTIPMEFFPLSPTGKPFKAPGSMVTHYPDFRHYSTRDYGNRVGIYRLLKVLEKYGVKANLAMNSEVAIRYPKLLKDILEGGHEIIAHGINMDTLHYGGMDDNSERIQVEHCLSTLRTLAGQAIEGWLSPAYSESFNTPDIVAEFGCKYICDWSNDDMPYEMKVDSGTLLALPLSQEISDRQIIINYHQSEDSFCEQVKDQFDTLYEEADMYGNRILSLTLTPYISGLPFRISTINEILKYIFDHKNVVNCTGSQIMNYYHTK
jgi:peptidoglycan/xylan/chitin deacetylase (PgdA/CDA1 family)